MKTESYIEELRTANVQEALVLPAIYGPKAYMMNGVIMNNPTWDAFGVTYYVKLIFAQTETQELLRDSVVQQVNSASLNGVRQLLADDSELRTNPFALVSPALEIGCVLDIEDEDKDAKTKVLYRGPLVVALLTQDFFTETGNSNEVFTTYQTALKEGHSVRVNNIVTRLGEFVQNASALISDSAVIASSTVDDTDIDSPATLAAANNIDARLTAARDRPLVALTHITQDSQRWAKEGVEGLTLKELLEELTDIFDAEMANALARPTLNVVEKLTSFVTIDETENLIGGDVDGTVSE